MDYIVIPDESPDATTGDGYKPYGAALQLMNTQEPEVLICGAAGTGKSRACLEKLNLIALNHSGSRLLICRKTRESLNEAALVTYEEKVLPANSPINQGIQRRVRQLYQYPNGSEIVVGGLTKDTRIMSTEFDCIFVQEATELTENDWEALTTRLRNGRAPYQQIIADCNPASPQHWLKKRCDRGQTRLITSTHKDNPTLWQSGEWTPAGREYLQKLESLTGIRKLRLFQGVWAMAEGMVYADVWNPELHLIPRFDVPADWPRYWAVDFGFTHPFIWQEWAKDHDGRLYRVREIYRTRRLVEDHARQILAVTKESPRPVSIVCDHDAEDRATLERHLGLPTVAAHKGISDGIQMVAARLRVAGDGKPRLFFFRDSLVEIDRELEENKKPTRTEEEVESYVWEGGREQGTGDRLQLKERPVKLDDHGLDATRYIVAHLDFNSSEGVFL